MANILRNLKLRFTTRKVPSPIRLTLNVDELIEHCNSTPFRWERTEFGYRGTLERGFGRTTVIEWNTSASTLTITDATNRHFRFLFYSSTRNEVTTVATSYPSGWAREQLESTFKSLINS
ncbi:MAG: hypothetical protein HYX89_07130 [Chloroflexi bacterium]|nr:hypothetical protein [Chloroflexota bacterium]